jgi:transposase
MKEHRDLAAWEQRRFEAIKLFEKGVKQAEIARRLSVTPQAVSNWVRCYKHAGKDELARKPHEGRPHKLSETQEKELLKQLERGPSAHGYSTELWSGERIARLIRDRYQVRMHFKHVPKLLRQLGWSYQRPTRRAAERDEAAVARWTASEWPRIKKKRGGRTPRSSSSTNLDSA